VAAFLQAEADGWVRERFGANPPLPVAILLESARQRLARAAAVHVDAILDGWEMLDCSEKDFTIDDFGGLALTGRIDRVDRHRDSGVIRVIDYKTSDGGTPPEKAHYRKARETDPELAASTITVNDKPVAITWLDLQLPLYRALVEANGFGGQVEVAYFNMPKAVSETAITAWDGFDADLYREARECALRVVAAVRSHCFWPPAEAAPKWDDFQALGLGAMADFVDGRALQTTVQRRAASAGKDDAS
jgi:ATP-dependent helicase/nuclease subunit B